MEQEEKLTALKELLLRSPRMSYDEAIRQIGSENLPTLYDLSSMRKFIHDTEGINQFQEDIEIKSRGLNPQKIGKVIFGSHLANPDSRYIWTGEYLGFAPDDHPAFGKIILSKIEGIDMNKSSPGLYGVLSNEVRGVVVPSKTYYTIPENIQKDRLCHITSFQEQGGLMIPLLQVEWSRETNVNEITDTGYGMLSTHVMLGRTSGDELKPIFAPICMRPSSHMKMGFTTGHVNHEFKAINKQKLTEILEA